MDLFFYTFFLLFKVYVIVDSSGDPPCIARTAPFKAFHRPLVAATFNYVWDASASKAALLHRLCDLPGQSLSSSQAGSQIFLFFFFLNVCLRWKASSSWVDIIYLSIYIPPTPSSHSPPSFSPFWDIFQATSNPAFFTAPVKEQDERQDVSHQRRRPGDISVESSPASVTRLKSLRWNKIRSCSGSGREMCFRPCGENRPWISTGCIPKKLT